MLIPWIGRETFLHSKAHILWLGFSDNNPALGTDYCNKTKGLVSDIPAIDICIHTLALALLGLFAHCVKPMTESTPVITNVRIKQGILTTHTDL